MAQPDKLTADDARTISVQAASVFQPRTPINRRDFFAGRWEQLTTIVDAVSQAGLHVVIYGERGVGKTSIANVIRPLLDVFDGQQGKPSRLIVKVNAASDDAFSGLWLRAFGEVTWVEVAPAFGFGKDEREEHRSVADFVSKTPTVDEVRKVLARLAGSVWVFDEFDRLRKKEARPFTDLMKALSDFAVDATIILVGVAETVEELVADHASIGRAIIQVPMPRMKPEELNEILKKAEAALGMRFEHAASERIVRMSQGLPHYTHLVGQNAVRSACDEQTRLIRLEDVRRGFHRAVQNATQSIKSSYSTATHSAHPDALYCHVLLGCAIAAYAVRDDQGFFQAVHVADPLSAILGKPVQIATFNKHLAEFSDTAKQRHVLERRGQQRSYRYRFHDPLMPPYVIMKGLAAELVTEEQVIEWVGEA